MTSQIPKISGNVQKLNFKISVFCYIIHPFVLPTCVCVVIKCSKLLSTRCKNLCLSSLKVRVTSSKTTWCVMGNAGQWHSVTSVPAGRHVPDGCEHTTVDQFCDVLRQVRRHIRPLFQSSSQMARLYDVLTFLVTRVVLSYITVPFVLLEFWAAIEFYK